MTHSLTPPSPRPAHFRLSAETWALIMTEYQQGATAPELAQRWRVSEHSLRKRITRDKATKRDWGDAEAIAQVEARDNDRAEAATHAPDARAARLFDGIEREPPPPAIRQPWRGWRRWRPDGPCASGCGPRRRPWWRWPSAIITSPPWSRRGLRARPRPCR